MIEMHLMQMDLRFRLRQIEQIAANIRKMYRRVTEFPFAMFLWFDGCAKGAAENLVAETYACEADVGAVDPDVCHQISQPLPVHIT
jgi:hypothetical protein